MLKATDFFPKFYVPLPRFTRPIQLGSASCYVLSYSFKSKKKLKDMLYLHP